MSANTPIAARAMIVLVGPPGSGKTTWARQNGQGVVHVSQDDLIDAITPHGFEHVYRPVYAQAEDAIARTALQAGQTVIVDRTNRTKEHRSRWLTIAKECDCPVYAVAMATPSDVCLARNTAREDYRRVSAERMQRMLAAMEPVTPEEGFAAIFTERDSLHQILMQLEKENETNEHCHQAR